MQQVENRYEIEIYTSSETFVDRIKQELPDNSMYYDAELNLLYSLSPVYKSRIINKSEDVFEGNVIELNNWWKKMKGK